jgi:hypothetical protein
MLEIVSALDICIIAAVIQPFREKRSDSKASRAMQK